MKIATDIVAIQKRHMSTAELAGYLGKSTWWVYDRTRQRGDGTTFEQDLAYWMKTIPEKVRIDGWLGLVLF